MATPTSAEPRRAMVMEPLLALLRGFVRGKGEPVLVRGRSS